MLGGVDVVEKDEAPVAESADEVPGLGGVAPHLELVAVAAHLVQVFAAVETQLLLPIISTVVVVEQQVVVRGDGREAVRVVVRGGPDLFNDVLREGVD